MNTKRLLAFVLAVALCLMSLSACGGAAASTPPSDAAPAKDKTDADSGAAASSGTKVAMLLTGVINDAGWNESAYKGLMTAEEKHGVEVAYTENVAQPDAETVLRDYATNGYDIIICHGFEFSDPVKTVSPDFPDSMFCVVNGDSTQEPNMASFRFNTPQTGFLAGAAAGLLTKTNVVGMVTGTRMPHLEDAMKGYEAGAKYVNPDCEVLLGYAESMTDVAKGMEMGVAYIEQGADVLCANANQVSLGVLDATKSKGLKFIGYIDDQYEVAPETVMVSAIQSVQFMVATIIERGVKGELKAELYLMGAGDGAICLSDFHGHEKDFPEGGAEKLEEIFNGLVDGSLAEQGIVPKSVFDV